MVPAPSEAGILGMASGKGYLPYGIDQLEFSTSEQREIEVEDTLGMMRSR